MAANRGILNESLTSHGRVQYHRNALAAVEAGKESSPSDTILPRKLNQSVEPPCGTCADFFSWSSTQYGAQGMASRRAASIGRPQAIAFAIGTIFDAAQGVLHLDQRLRRQGVFLERLGSAFGGSGGISKISDFGFTRNAHFRFEACDLRLKFAFLLAQALFEAFDIHSSDDNPAGTSQRWIALMALIGLAGVTLVAVYFSFASHRRLVTNAPQCPMFFGAPAHSG
jgi:hypothetical protein